MRSASTPTPARVCTGSSIRSTAPSTCTRSSRPRTPSGSSPASTSRTSRPRSPCTVTAPADWQVVSNGATTSTEPGPAGAAVHRFATTEPMSTYVTALIAGPYHVVRDHHDGIDLGIFCRSSAGRAPGRGPAVHRDQAGFRLLPRGVRGAVPVRQVRPAVRAGVQRRRDGERRRGDLPRGVRLPVPGHPATCTSAAARRSCTRWPTCGSAIWSPCAGGTTCG